MTASGSPLRTSRVRRKPSRMAAGDKTETQADPGPGCQKPVCLDARQWGQRPAGWGRRWGDEGDIPRSAGHLLPPCPEPPCYLVTRGQVSAGDPAGHGMTSGDHGICRQTKGWNPRGLGSTGQWGGLLGPQAHSTGGDPRARLCAQAPAHACRESTHEGALSSLCWDPRVLGGEEAAAAAPRGRSAPGRTGRQLRRIPWVPDMGS